MEGRRRASGGVLLCLALTAALAACGGSGVASVAPSGGIGSTGAGSPTAGQPVDPSAALDAAFAAFEGGYQFEAEVTVGQATATHAAGRRVGANAEFEVTSDGSTVTYRTVGSDAWVKRAGADWVAVDGSKTAADPLAALRTPLHVEAGPTVTGGTSLVATYPASALGLTGADRTVTVLVGDDGSVEATYQLTTAAGPAVSHTTFKPMTDTTPIVPPSAPASPVPS